MKNTTGQLILEAQFIANVYWGYEIVHNVVKVLYYQVRDQAGHSADLNDLAYEVREYIRDKHDGWPVDFEAPMERRSL